MERTGKQAHKGTNTDEKIKISMEKQCIDWLKNQREMCAEKLKLRQNGVIELRQELENIEELLAFVDGQSDDDRTAP